MINGWDIIKQLEEHDPEIPIDSKQICKICDELSEYNNQLLGNLIKTLRNKKHNKCAEGLDQIYKISDEKLFNSYFANEAFSPFVLKNPPKKFDGPQSALLFYLSYDLQCMLIDQLNGIANAYISGIKPDTPKADNLTRIYRFVGLHQILIAIKSVQYDVEDFACRANHLLVGNNNKGFSSRSSYWPFDAEILLDVTLLGFMRSPTKGIINRGIVSSPVVASGLVRSYLEAVLFKKDFKSSLQLQQPLRVRDWEDALKVYGDNGKLKQNEIMWINKAYGLLSASLHCGLLFSRGEIWMIYKVVRYVANRLNHN